MSLRLLVNSPFSLAVVVVAEMGVIQTQGAFSRGRHACTNMNVLSYFTASHLGCEIENRRNDAKMALFIETQHFLMCVNFYFFQKRINIMRARQLPTILRTLSEHYPDKLKHGEYDKFMEGPAIKNRSTTKAQLQKEISERFGVHPKSSLKKDHLALLLFALIVFGKKSFNTHPDVYRPFVVRAQKPR